MHIYTSFSSTMKNWRGTYRAIHFVYLPTNESCNFSRSGENVRAHLLPQSFSRNYRSIQYMAKLANARDFRTNKRAAKAQPSRCIWGYMSRDMRFPTIWYVRPAKPQTSLRIRALWSELCLGAWIFNHSWAIGHTSFEVSKLRRRLHRLIWVYTCQNTTLLEITCRGSIIWKFGPKFGSLSLLGTSRWALRICD